MTVNEKIIDGICQRIDQDLGDGTTAAKLKNFEAVVLAQTLQPPKRETQRIHRRRNMLLAAAIFLFALVPTVVFVGMELHETPLQLNIDNQPINGLSPTAVQTGKDNTKKIQFANNSSIQLMNNTDATVQKATDGEVIVQLAQGELFLDVEGKESESWIVDVGDYRVSVLGTRFYVKREKRGQLIDVRVLNGTVLVEGKHAGKVGIAVHGDTHLRLDTLTGFSAKNSMSSAFYDADSPSLLHNESELQTVWNTRMGINETPKALSCSDTGARDDVNLSTGTDGTLVVKRHRFKGRHTHSGKAKRQLQKNAKYNAALQNDHSTSADTAANVSQESWNEMLARGDFQGAITAAESAGFSGVIEQASLSQLWQLMNAARKSKRDELAEQILHTCRRRFATTRKARLAAFVLGKVNYYGKNDADSAAKWFETYLSEAPSGTLAEEAMGRLISIQSERGNTADAKTLAATYLKRYPSGAFSKTCQELIGN